MQIIFSYICIIKNYTNGRYGIKGGFNRLLKTVVVAMDKNNDLALWKIEDDLELCLALLII